MDNVFISEIDGKSYKPSQIPAWLIEKKYPDHKTLTCGACILAINDGTCGFVKETEKALLFDWSNQSLMSCRAAGGEFWVAKSLLN